MSKFIFIGVLASVLLIVAGAVSLGGSHIVLFHPAGPVASQEVALMWLATWLMLIVVIPLFVLAGAMAWRYRASNTKARYMPNWEHNNIDEAVWWTVPIIIILILAGVAWRSAHTLDPFKPIQSDTPTLTVQVIALDWKWLFIYPAQGIATVNYLEIPYDTPVNFVLTSDAPMNAFWIPQLGGMEMMMPGMVTHLNLLANTAGTYRGVSSNLSGDGFAGMHFPVYSVAPDAFTSWAAGVKASSAPFARAQYDELAEPSANAPQAFYKLTDPSIFDMAVMQYMMSSTSMQMRVQTNTIMNDTSSTTNAPTTPSTSMQNMNMDVQ